MSFPVHSPVSEVFPWFVCGIARLLQRLWRRQDIPHGLGRALRMPTWINCLQIHSFSYNGARLLRQSPKVFHGCSRVTWRYSRKHRHVGAFSVLSGIHSTTGIMLFGEFQGASRADFRLCFQIILSLMSQGFSGPGTGQFSDLPMLIRSSATLFTSENVP